MTSYQHKLHCLRKVQAYLEYKGVTNTSQINQTTFDEYLEFRSDTTRILQARELAVLGEWIKSYLIRYDYIDSKLWLSGTFLPKVEVRQVDRMANPAINPEDWKTIVDHVRDEWRPKALEPRPYSMRGELKGTLGPVKKTIWYRDLFWHYILFSKNTGMSPEEVLKLKWKNVEIRDVGRLSKSKYRQEVEELAAEGIDVMGDGFEEEDIDGNAWAPTESHLGREERLVAYITTIRSKTKQAREIPCNQGRELRRWKNIMVKHLKEWDIDYKINMNDYVFMNPFNDFEPASQRRIGSTWRGIVDKLQKEGVLKGHKFSEHRYTLYSMRSTFIEDHLVKGTDIFLVARIAGHDVKTLMQTYERLDIRKRAEEITSINYGKKSKRVPVVNLFDD
jgi:integrase